MKNKMPPGQILNFNVLFNTLQVQVLNITFNKHATLRLPAMQFI